MADAEVVSTSKSENADCWDRHSVCAWKNLEENQDNFSNTTKINNCFLNERMFDLFSLKAHTDGSISKVAGVLSVKGWKTLWEKEKCWSPAFSPFPSRF